MKPVLPGKTIGILGSGQLGRMLAMAARPMGYLTHVFSPEGSKSPAGQVCDFATSAAYTHEEALVQFAQSVDVITLEFENIPLSSVQTLSQWVPVRPGARALEVAQHRLREKTFLKDHGFPIVPFYPVFSESDLYDGGAFVGLPAVLKTAGFGYDGKGQIKITASHEIKAAWQKLQESPSEEGYVLEQFIAFEEEVSVIVARSVTGEIRHYPVIENRHRHHILDVSVCPAAIPRKTANSAIAIAQSIAENLDLVGLLCVEFFVTSDGEVLVNEIAPRPHNSGHLTIEGCVTSQFEQQLRAICALPLGSTTLLKPVAMANLLGDLWHTGTPHWQGAWAQSAEIKLHLYGKAEARAGRKMGHLTTLGDSSEAATRAVEQARAALLTEAMAALGER